MNKNNLRNLYFQTILDAYFEKYKYKSKELATYSVSDINAIKIDIYKLTNQLQPLFTKYQMESHTELDINAFNNMLSTLNIDLNVLNNYFENMTKTSDSIYTILKVYLKYLDNSLQSYITMGRNRQIIKEFDNLRRYIVNIPYYLDPSSTMILDNNNYLVSSNDKVKKYNLDNITINHTIPSEFASKIITTRFLNNINGFSNKNTIFEIVTDKTQTTMQLQLSFSFDEPQLLNRIIVECSNLILWAEVVPENSTMKYKSKISMNGVISGFPEGKYKTVIIHLLSQTPSSDIDKLTYTFKIDSISTEYVYSNISGQALLKDIPLDRDVKAIFLNVDSNIDNIEYKVEYNSLYYNVKPNNFDPINRIDLPRVLTEIPITSKYNQWLLTPIKDFGGYRLYNIIEGVDDSGGNITYDNYTIDVTNKLIKDDSGNTDLDIQLWNGVDDWEITLEKETSIMDVGPYRYKYVDKEGQIYKLVLSTKLTGVDSTPPSSPSNGDIYLVLDNATGDWTGHDNELATYDGSSWSFQDLIGSNYEPIAVYDNADPDNVKLYVFYPNVSDRWTEQQSYFFEDPNAIPLLWKMEYETVVYNATGETVAYKDENTNTYVIENQVKYITLPGEVYYPHEIILYDSSLTPVYVELHPQYNLAYDASSNTTKVYLKSGEALDPTMNYTAVYYASLKSYIELNNYEVYININDITATESDGAPFDAMDVFVNDYTIKFHTDTLIDLLLTYKLQIMNPKVKKIYSTYITVSDTTTLVILPFNEQELIKGNFHMIDDINVSQLTSYSLNPGTYLIKTTQPYPTTNETESSPSTWAQWNNSLTGEPSKAGIIIPTNATQVAYSNPLRQVTPEYLSTNIRLDDTRAFAFENGKIYLNRIPEFIDDTSFNDTTPDYSIEGEHLTCKKPIWSNGQIVGYESQPEQFLLKVSSKDEDKTINIMISYNNSKENIEIRNITLIEVV